MTGSPRTITGLRSDKRLLGNLVVEVDGARFASIPGEAASFLGLERGRELDQGAYESLTRVADVEAAYRVALRLLATRPRAVNELLRKLRERGHNPSAVAKAVGRLEARGLLDDAEFARHFARVRSARGHGPPRILTDLLARGVEQRLADKAIVEVLDREGIDPLQQARALAVKRAEQLGDLPRDTRLRRVLGYLSRRGYRGRDVTEIVMEVVGEERE